MLFRPHRTGNDTELTAPRRNSPFTRHTDLFAKVLLFLQYSYGGS